MRRTDRTTVPPRTSEADGIRPALLRAAGFVSFFDRFGTAPMLVVLAHGIGVGLAAAVQIVSVYALAYALGQPLWGLISDRVGRLAVLRVALAGTALASLASILLPGYAPLLVARAVTGLMVGALFPTALTLVGDRYDGVLRQRRISELQTSSAIGTTVATLAAGSVAVLVDWRAVFVVTLVVALALLLLLRRSTAPRPVRIAGSLRSAFGGWALGVYGLGFAEGLVLLGVLTYLVPALEQDGVPVVAAGAVASVYGVGIVAGALVVRRLGRPERRPALMAAGGLLLLAGYGIAAQAQDPLHVGVAALGIGLANACLHGALQGWATEVAPAARATAVSLFVTSLFLGSAAATAATAALAAQGRFGVVFGGTAVASVLIGLVAAVAYRAWRGRSATPAVGPALDTTPTRA